MLKRIATQTFPPLFRPPQTYKCQDIICWIYFWWQRQKSCAYKQEGDLLRKYSCKCVVYLLQYRQLTPVAQQSLQTDSALILIFGSHTRGLSLRLWTKSVFRNRGSCSRISNLTCLSSFEAIFCCWENRKDCDGLSKYGRLVITQNGFIHKAHISIGKLLVKCQKFSV